MLVNIRDDDTNALTTKNDIVSAYSLFNDYKGITLGIVPFIHDSHFYMLNGSDCNATKCKKLENYEANLSVSEFGEYMKLSYFHENTELIEFIDNNVFEIALHGVTHKFLKNGAEFYAIDVPEEDVKNAKRYLEELLKRDIVYFIPPSNAISENNLESLCSNKLSLLSSANPVFKNKISKFVFLYGKYCNIEHLSQCLLKKYQKWNSSFRGVNIINSVTFGPGMNREDFIKKYERIARFNGFISIATHYHALNRDEKHKQDLFYIVDYFINKYEGRMATIQDISNYVNKKK
ncbi:DUF2334 domain-containing protein [Vibrio parahaemolyticus]|nr:DUF2334 domain-containing protein [Vibrio parahaemolyticus]